MQHWIEVFRKFIATLTPVKVVLLGSILIMAVLTLSFYENRQQVYTKVFKPGILSNEGFTEVSTETKAQIDRVMVKHPEIAILALIRLDFDMGKRVPLYRAYNDAEIARRLGDRYAEHTSKTPLGTLPIFSDNQDSNRDMVQILNGEFVCTRPDPQGILKTFPELTGKIKLSCRIPIPPAINYGAPRGYIAIHLREEPKSEELAAITKDLLSLAMFIYMTDVKGEQSLRIDK